MHRFDRNNRSIDQVRNLDLCFEQSILSHPTDARASGEFLDSSLLLGLQALLELRWAHLKMHLDVDG